MNKMKSDIFIAEMVYDYIIYQVIKNVLFLVQEERRQR